MVTIPSFESGGETIFYEEAGAGQPVVLLHSLGASSGMWSREIERLSGSYRCLAPDCRGHGRSTGRGEITRDAIVGDVIALLDHAGVETAHVVGLSMGGCWALSLAERCPERVRSLALCDTFASVPDPEAPVRARRNELETLSMDEFARRYVAATLQPGAPAEVAADLERVVAGVSKRAYLETAQACFSSQNDHVLPSVRVPTLVMVGDRDERTPVAFAEKLVAGIAGARLVVVPGGGHLSNLDNPGVFDAALEAHLGAAARASGA